MENKSLQRLTGIISIFLMLFLVIIETCCTDVSLYHNNVTAIQGRVIEENFHPFQDENSSPFQYGKSSYLILTDESGFNRIKIELTRIIINTVIIHEYIVLRI